MATFTWVISTLERDLLPADMNGAVVVAHWRCNAEQTEGTGDDAVTYNASSYGTCGFTPDPTASDYIPYNDLTEQVVVGWCQNELDQDAIEAGLQANIDAQITPTTATGTPWAA
ncbi:hypothetical protein [uncultured Mediterranean phage uvMED]|nr:hypothetical protein [uncultured Mediterranean phage uvMED]